MVAIRPASASPGTSWAPSSTRPADVQLKPAYSLAEALDDRDVAKAIAAVARQIEME